MGVKETVARNFEERVAVLLGLRGDRKERAVRHGELEQLVERILTKRAALLNEGITTGSGPEGNFIRIEGGIQICWRRVFFTAAINVSYQGQYRTEEFLWNFPAPFADTETVIKVQPAAGSASGSYVNKTDTANCRWALTNATSISSAARGAHLWAMGFYR